MWFAREASIPYLLAYTYSLNVASAVRERLDLIMRAISESGLIYIWMQAMSESFGQLPNTKVARTCMTDLIADPEMEPQPIDVRNMKQVLKAFSGSLAVCIVIHVAMLPVFWDKETGYLRFLRQICSRCFGRRSRRKSKKRATGREIEETQTSESAGEAGQLSHEGQRARSAWTSSARAVVQVTVHEIPLT